MTQHFLKFKESAGFTLIETLVAVTILTLAVVGPMFTASRAIVAAQISRDQLTASYLAQEGIEHMRAVRDNAYLALYPGDTSAAWANFLTSTSQCNATSPNTTRACTLDPVNASPLVQCSVGSCAPMYLTLLSGNNYGYTQQSGTVTPFTRIIQLINVSATDERVISKVSWDFKGSTYSVTIYDHLTPWQ